MKLFQRFLEKSKKYLEKKNYKRIVSGGTPGKYLLHFLVTLKGEDTHKKRFF